MPTTQEATVDSLPERVRTPVGGSAVASACPTTELKALPQAIPTTRTLFRLTTQGDLIDLL
jgi:hypothetical protein